MILGFLAAFCGWLAFSHADNVGPIHARHKPISRFGDPGKKNPKLTVRGHCSVLEGGDNPIVTPCSNVLLKLTDTADTSREIEDRTDKNGDFAFAIESGRRYTLQPSSKSYATVGPKKIVKGGDASVDLKIKPI
jgi:hypothetical protein